MGATGVSIDPTLSFPSSAWERDEASWIEGEMVQSMKEAMVARAQKRKWIDLIGGLLVGAATQPLALLAGPDTGLTSLPAAADGSERIVAQASGRSSRARSALNAGIDAERLGEYEKAATLYGEAQARASDLSPDERRELQRRISANTLAIQARREAREQLGLADSAFQHGKSADAAALLKKITAKELYLSPADKQRFQTLCQRLHVQPGASPSANLHAASTAASTSAGNTEKARVLVRQGREALSRGDVAQARKCAEQASTLNAVLSWSEDNPARLLEDVSRASGKSAKPADGSSRAGSNSPVASIKTKEDALAQLKLGREQLTKGNLDEANKTAARLHAASHIHWGLFFEDTPDKFQADVDHARSQRDKHEAVELLGEARRRFEKKDYDGAEKLAYEARTKHGPYSIWDLGDRPDKVLADVQLARQKDRRVKLPEPPAKQNQVADLSRGPLAQNGINVKADQARRILMEARLALNNGAPAQARLLADRVRDMHVVLNAPGDDSPENIYRDIERMAQRPQANGGAAVTQVSANMPQTPMPQPSKPQPPSPYLSNQQANGGKGKGSSGSLDAQTRARQLMAEARMLQQQNRLLEARDKIVAAQRLNVSFRFNEETPNQLYQQLALQARQNIDGLVRHAGDTIRLGTQAPMARCQDAERDLAQARQLAVTFGLDVQPIHAAMQMVNQLRATGSTALASAGSLPPVVNTAGSPGMGGQLAANAGRWSQMLDQSRMELRSGQTANARHFAEEAVKFGAGEAGLAVLRSIDTEEDAQNRRRNSRTFDEVVLAYDHRDYRRASLILASIDTAKLDERRRVRLREMLNTPEMQANAHGNSIALTGAQNIARTGGQAFPSDSQAGQARATDESGQAMLLRVQGMRKIKVEQLRTEGLKIQAQALERFRTGQTDLAVDMLQEWLARLSEEQLDPAQLAMLRRPIDSRLQQFQLLKAQSDLANNRFDERSRGVKANIAKAKNAEQVKQKNVAQLMKQYNELFHDAKYPEAELVARRVKELDPDNPMATAAIQMAQYQRNHSEYESDKERKENLWLGAMHDVDNMGERDAIDNGITFTKDEKRLKTIQGRKALGFDGVSPQRMSTEERNIERKLTAPISLSFANQPLREVISYIQGDQGLNIFIDEPALADKGIQLDYPVTVKLDNISLKSALKLVLSYVHLTYFVADDVLKITTEDQARGKLKPVVYPVGDLVIAVENYGEVGKQPDPVTQLGLVNVNQALNQTMPATSFSGMPGGQSVSMPSVPPGGSMANMQPGNFATESSGGNVQVTKQRQQTHEDMLIKLITNTIAPHSWAEQGGAGTIDYHPLTLALVVNQTPDIQDQIQDLLNALRRLMDQEVAVEVKIISIAEDFFERIGVNFNLNLLNKSRSAMAAQPELVSGQFANPAYINYFAPNNLLSGLTPAGTLTSDLNIPLTQMTYPQAVPPFGGYPGIPGYGGLTLGLAFLSDIQVFLFMEAVQGDTRTNVMQAPKLTLFNGQTATIAVQDYQFFTIGVSVLNGGYGQVVYNPITTLFPMNIILAINAVISGDRRFVRLSIAPSLANVVNGEVNLFPVVTPIFPLFDGTATGQPVVFTQFIQQPRLTRVSVATTVAVPDGGTVLMGGLKRLSEGRNEFGPPVLSKIPYLNRLFRNIGYGRSAESLLIMVTPRIIIQAEEEETQTGYRPPSAVE
jgi:type II secretory pathway component GspD/PulD (secretin)